MILHKETIQLSAVVCLLFLVETLVPIKEIVAQEYEPQKVVIQLREELPDISPYSLYESMNSFTSVNTEIMRTFRQLKVLGFERALKSLIIAPGSARIPVPPKNSILFEL